MRTVEQRRKYRRNRYATDLNFKELLLNHCKNYSLKHSESKELHRIKHKEFSKTVVGKEIRSRANIKRKRSLGFEPVNDWFPDSHAHHINSNQVIYIPIVFHKAFRHNHNNLESMLIINRIAFQYLTDTVKQL